MTIIMHWWDSFLFVFYFFCHNSSFSVRAFFCCFYLSRLGFNFSDYFSFVKHKISLFWEGRCVSKAQRISFALFSWWFIWWIFLLFFWLEVRWVLFSPLIRLIFPFSIILPFFLFIFVQFCWRTSFSKMMTRPSAASNHMIIPIMVYISLKHRNIIPRSNTNPTCSFRVDCQSHFKILFKLRIKLYFHIDNICSRC